MSLVWDNAPHKPCGRTGTGVMLDDEFRPLLGKFDILRRWMAALESEAFGIVNSH